MGKILEKHKKDLAESARITVTADHLKIANNSIINDQDFDDRQLRKEVSQYYRSKGLEFIGGENNKC